MEFAFLGFCACVGLWFIERGILQLECAFLAVRIVIMRCTLRMSAEVLDKGFLWLILIHIIYYYLRYQQYGWLDGCMVLLSVVTDH